MGVLRDIVGMLVLLHFYVEDWGAVLIVTLFVAQRCFLPSAATLRDFSKRTRRCFFWSRHFLILLGHKVNTDSCLSC
jgi:hypothetical protein